MKILIYSDNHFCTSSSIINGVGEKYSTRLENQIQTMNWLEKLSKEQRCDLEICCGDFFDKEILSSQEISALKEIIWNDIDKEFIVGNHEMGNQDLTFNSTNALSEYGYICNKPQLIYDEYCNIILLPYILESDRKPLKYYINKAIEDGIGKDGVERHRELLPTIVFTHNDIKDMQYGSFISKQGIPLKEIEENCELFFNGHLHNKSNINNKIWIVGNITGLNFNEDAQIYQHNAYILDTSTLKIEIYENPYAFNFYKLEIYNEEDIEKLNKLKQNSIVSIKTSQKIVNKIKEIVYNNKEIIKSRFTLIPDYSEIKEETKNTLISKDHITQFKDFTYPKVREELAVDDEIIKDELRRI